ncbi:MAG: PQQ-binding-like beta-propeller repeat protein [Vicinamibacterales bacterium]
MFGLRTLTTCTLVLLVSVFVLTLAAQSSPLFTAAAAGDVETVDRLAQGGADPNVTGEIRLGDRSYRVSAIAAAALGWYADAARSLLKRGARPPQYLVRNHNLIPFSSQDLDALRDWEVVNTILRTPEVAAITRPIVERDGAGTYRTHDGREYTATLEDGGLRLKAPGSPDLRFQLVEGKAFMQRTAPGDAVSSSIGRERTAQDLAMYARFIEPLPAADRAALVEQFRDRGGMWLEFTVGEGRVLGLEIRDGGPARLGGTPVLFRKVGVKPEASPLLEREIASTRPTAPPINWPSFRGPGGSGVADGQFPPTAWDAEKSANIRWRTPIPGLGHSSPVTWGDRIFLTSAVSSLTNPEFRPGGLRSDNVSTDQSEHEWRVLALDKGTGKILWQQTARRGVPRDIRHLKSTLATPTPATDGKRVVALFGSEGLFCYDIDGRLIWQKDLGRIGHFNYGFSSSPIIVGDLAIIQADTNVDARQATSASFIAAFDLATGRERWRTSRDEDRRSSNGTPTFYEGLGRPQIIANGGNGPRAYDPATGKEIWSLSAPSDIVTPTPVVGHNLIFVMSGNGGYQPIFAIRPSAIGDISLKAGTESNDFVSWSSARGGAFTPTPIVYGDYIYSINVSGIVGCYDAKTGARQYVERIEHAGSGFSSSPVAADGRLYFASEDGDVFVVRAGPKFELIATNPMGEVIMATPAVSGGMIFIRTLGHLVAVG